jgi:uncharacterized protein (DUF2267 family)
MLCSKCLGSGKVMGNGMIFEDCYCDEGIEKADDLPPVPVLDKRSKAYREAILRLMKENGMDRNAATKAFETEFNKLS